MGAKENYLLKLSCGGMVLEDCFGGILPPFLLPMPGDVLAPMCIRLLGTLSI